MRALLLVSTLALPLAQPAAQEAEAVPQPLLRVACDGPAAFRQSFLATNVGGLLGADENQPLIRPVQELLLQVFADQRATLWPELRDYRGRIELLVFARPSEQRREVLASGLLRMTDDGDTDLDKVGRGLTALLRRLGGEEATVQLDGEERAALRMGGETMVMPYRVGDGLSIVYAKDSDDQLAEVAAFAAARPLGRARDDAPFELELDLQQTAQVTMHAEGSGSDDWKIAEVIWGIESLRSLHVSARAAGPQVLFEIQGRFDPGPGGILRGFMPDVQGEPTMTHLIPEDCPAWKDGRLRLDQVVDSCVDALAAIFNDGNRKTFDEDMVKELGFHPVKDLLVHLGDEVLWLGGPWLRDTDEEQGGSGMPFEGTCLVFQIRKPAAFGETWPVARQGLLQSVAITPEKLEHAGAEIVGGSSYLLETSMWLCVADGFGLMAFGDAGLTQLQGVLDRRKTEAGPLPSAVQRMRRQAPPGFNGAARADLEAMFGGQIGFLKEVITEILSETGLPLEADGVMADFAPYARLLAKHELDQVVTLTGYEAGTWTFRVLW